MLLKSADSKDDAIKTLESLLAAVPAAKRGAIEAELRLVRAGIKAEQEAAYHIDFDFKPKDNYVVIHDLRIEVNGRVAQIDHLLLNRRLDCFVLETKSFHAGVKITEDGEFLRWNDFKKAYEGMASPLEQNRRHIAVLQDAFATEVKLPTRLGFTLTPKFQSFVLVSKDARIIRPEKFDASNVIHLDTFRTTLLKQLDGEGVLTTIVSGAKMVDVGTLVAIGRQLMALHQPQTWDYEAKFRHLMASGPLPPAATATVPASRPAPTGPQEARPAGSGPLPASGPSCKECRGTKGAIAYGKYGYYFVCAACEANTSVRVDCGVAGHKERVRKEGTKFFRECADCGTSRLYFENVVPAQA